MILPKNRNIAFRIDTSEDYELSKQLILSNFQKYLTEYDYSLLTKNRNGTPVPTKIWIYYLYFPNKFGCDFPNKLGYDFLTTDIELNMIHSSKNFLIVNLKKYLRINKLNRINSNDIT